ncbi:putative nickel-responsive regulator [archaeon]|nr:putative nickel-responsive regulator [archaeon]
MYVKKTITLPKELERDVEKLLIGKHYSNFSEVIRDGLRKILREYEEERSINAVAEMYKAGKVSMREAADILDMPLRQTMGEFAKRKVYLRYGMEELAEDSP